MSGRFPNSHDVNHFRDNLLNKVDMISDDERRWKHVNPIIPKRAGRIYDVADFDPGAFGKLNFYFDTFRIIHKNNLTKVLVVARVTQWIQCYR